MALPQSAELILAARQDLVHIALVPSVEDDRISWRVEDPMHRKCQLDDSEVGSKVAAGLAHLLDQERPDLQAQLLQLIWRQVPRSCGLRIELNSPFGAADMGLSLRVQQLR